VPRDDEEKVGPQGDLSLIRGWTSSAAFSRFRLEKAWRRTHGGDVRRRAMQIGFWAGGRALLHPGRKVPARDVHGSRRSTPPAPTMFHTFHTRANYCRFRISPDITMALAPTSSRPGQETLSHTAEMLGTRLRAPMRWTRTSECWRRHARRRHAVRPGGLRRRGCGESSIPC